jgi:hypothetical protein
VHPAELVQDVATGLLVGGVFYAVVAGLPADPRGPRASLGV